MCPDSVGPISENFFSMHEYKFEMREAAVENRRKGKIVRHIELYMKMKQQIFLSGTLNF